MNGLLLPSRMGAQGNVDGAYFGTTFPHLLLMTYPALWPAKPTESYVPRVFGFKLHRSGACDRDHALGSSQRQSTPAAVGEPSDSRKGASQQRDG
jgi:Casein kinase II regulatory subunit